MTVDADRFLERFRAFGAQPDVARYLALFHPDATLFDSGMERPITVPEIPEHIEGILKLAPDFRMTPERWRLRGVTIFVEAHNQATLGGRRVEWPSVYVIDLRGDQVIRGRRYYDRRPLVSRVFPGVPSQPPFAFALPAPPGPIATRDPESFVRTRANSMNLAARLRLATRERAHSAGDGFEFELSCWAGDAALLFLEWRATGAVGGKPVEFGVAERFDRGAGRAYFDSLALSPP
jgi:ketosteroid isomerase-like protein